jgi:uncharacterized protein YgiM (DUF1202 family)
VSVTYFFVSKSVNLRECPKEVCPSLQLLSRGERVQKIESDNQGWCRVLVAKSRHLGWLPAEVLTESLQETQTAEPGKLYLYVAVQHLKLYREAMVKAEVVKLLRFNDQVEKLQDQTPAGWLKVRQPSSGAVGWVQGHYLATLPSRFPRFWRRHRFKPKPAKPAETQPPPPAQPGESAPQPEPEIM